MAKTSITSSIFFSKARLALSFLAVGTRGRESCMIIMRMSTAENVMMMVMMMMVRIHALENEKVLDLEEHIWFRR